VKRRGRFAAVIVVALTCLLGPATGASATEPGVRVVLDQTQITTRIGATFTLRAKITNTAGTPARGVIAHLNVLSLTPGVEVDPEDWSANRTRYLPPLPARGSKTLVWRLQAVTGGKIGVYVAATSRRGVGAPSTGPIARAVVTEHRTLNSNGILPLAIGVPALLALLTLGLRTRRRRALT
jgi:hypothetical protein